MVKKIVNSDKKAQTGKATASARTKPTKTGLNQKKNNEPRHHIIHEDPKYPQRGNTDPFEETSLVY